MNYKHLVKLSAVLMCAACGLAACDKDPYTIVTKGTSDNDGGPGDDADNQDGGIQGDGDTDTVECQPTKEVCDGKDNNCDDKIDNVAPEDLETDANNCGGCGQACVYINAFAKCEKGVCAMANCAPGFYDNDQKSDNGCEYQCLPTNGGDEKCPANAPDCSCDNADNDCDGKIDEDYDLQKDLNNCGSCGNKCLYNSAVASCDGGTCKMGACTDGFVDLNKKDTDGCEYKCPVYPPVNETCNASDDDCDGEVDEGLPGAGQNCDSGLKGECKAGKTACGVTLKCVQINVPTSELCDGKDNDCDGSVDEDFDLNTDLGNCGACNKPCAFDNAIAKCTAKVCSLVSCDIGYKNFDNNATNGCEHKCQVFPESAEKCNGLDDDCDKLVDEDFNKNTDPNHCGACGNACKFDNAQATCAAGKCVMGACNANFVDGNKDPKDGCEYFCVKTNNGVEVCDNIDNDCDGQVDETFALGTDPNNCGFCGNVCLYSNGTGACDFGLCFLQGCANGYRDLDKLAGNGCEYKCPVNPPAATDGCDGIDNDCDGAIDENFTATACGSAVGECKQGTNECIGGNVFCKNNTGPSAEICDNKDNDCNGTVDNGYDKQNDPRYCGTNCTQCSIPNAIAKCVAGVCQVAVCNAGYVDDPNQPGVDCNYNCTVTGNEICDGLDNDCDKQTDEGVTLAGNPCVVLAGTPCAGTTATCQGVNGWVCNYPASVELRSCTITANCGGLGPCVGGKCLGVIASQETLCDGIDNDCDKVADESFTNKGTSCAESGKTGICQGKGTFQCRADKTNTECVITTPGQAKSDEKCNAQDDDCDGLTDEEADDAAGKGVVDSMVQINRTYAGKAYNFWIYRYEASRPDATAASLGVKTNRACSNPSVQPWSSVTYIDANAACAAAGKRLCTEDEWFVACSGAPVTDTNGACPTGTEPGCIYPYGDNYAPDNCNGRDFDSNGGAAGNGDTAVTTGSRTQCISYDQVYDMSGNLMEWTSTQVSASPVVRRIRGGSFNSIKQGLTCQLKFVSAEPDFLFVDLGFRCCSDTAP